MAKCLICNSRKGKRKCMAENSLVCSLCCGQSRTPEKCTGCSFYKDVSLNKNYRKVPFYGTERMSDSMELQDVANVIESILCKFDIEGGDEFKDKTALQFIELAIDKYHFKETELAMSDSTLNSQFQSMLQIIEQDL